MAPHPYPPPVSRRRKFTYICIMKKILTLAALLLSACTGTQPDGWTEEELQLIDAEDSTMRVLTIGNKDDLTVLRDTCTYFSEGMLLSTEYARLAEKMVATVTSPEQDGVGIAGPQVGICRRIVSVQRFDKEGEPFETYPNIRITATRGEKEEGPEGCLSVPDRRGDVMRWRDIDIRYSKVSDGCVRDTVENVTGFTAVIFQHECDHLDGILYIDLIQQ